MHCGWYAFYAFLLLAGGKAVRCFGWSDSGSGRCVRWYRRLSLRHIMTSVELAPVAQDRGVIVGQGHAQFLLGGSRVVAVQQEAIIEM